MAYETKPVYHFDTKTDTGIDVVPVGRLIICRNKQKSTMH